MTNEIQDPSSISSTAPVASSSSISEYELTRQQNIERNNAFLKEIGLFETKQHLEDQISSSTTSVSPKSPRSKASKRKLKENSEENGTLIRRKSTRLSKSPDDESANEPLLQLPETFREPSKSRVYSQSSGDVDIVVDEEERAGRLTTESLSQHIEQKNKDHFEDAKPEAIHHTVHRINTMSNKQLAMRMRKITNTDKMLLFYYALDCIGLTELAASAKEILIKIHHIDFK